MRKLEEFVSKERERFSIKDNNIFAFSFGKVTRRWMFLEIIRERYRGASAAFVANSEAMRATNKPGGPHLLTAEQLALQSEGVRLSMAVHLDIESFYLFAKIFLDDIARAIENYFGPARGLALDSHDDLEKRLERYADTKGLLIPNGLRETISDLRKRVADFRDQEIAHEKSPRTMRGLTWGPDGEASFISTRLYPKESDKQTNSESLDGLASAFEEYVSKVVDFLEENSSKARFEPAEEIQTS